MQMPADDSKLRYPTRYWAYREYGLSTSSLICRAAGVWEPGDLAWPGVQLATVAHRGERSRLKPSQGSASDFLGVDYEKSGVTRGGRSHTANDLDKGCAQADPDE